ncbi:NADPH:quinone oxidoreductase family protein [Candidatus Poriferisodalis sp.]|uniref:NADPH:quinone oxidoreductase family protein n=1 Tax=Candidatus Poriferisodalis sp. TaxID=3101277 RepID=UPI003B01DC4E
MRAWRLNELGYPWDVLELGEYDSPEPGPGQARIAVEAADLNFADILHCQGTYQERWDPPFTPGMGACGTVTALGPECGLDIGVRVIGNSAGGWGGYASEALIKCATARRVPDDVSLPAACAANVIYGTAWFSLYRRGQMRAGETVLVLAAAGGVGSAAVQMAKAAGCTVLAAAGGPAKTETCRGLGADVVIDYDSDDLYQNVMDATGGRGCDIVYDPVGGEYFDVARRLVAWEGRLLVVGFASGTIPSAPANHVLVKNYSVVGVHMGGYRGRKDEVLEECYAEIWPQVANGTLEPLISRQLPLEGLLDGLRDLHERRTTGRVLLRPDLPYS